MAARRDWLLEGEYFEACNCRSVCPCIWMNPPSEGDCRLLVAWHIRRGHLENVSLGNLNVAMACYAPGPMIEGNWQAVLYLDCRVDRGQHKALESIFGGREGGHPALLMEFVSRVLAVQLAQIEYEAQDRKRRMVVEGLAQMEIEGIEGIEGIRGGVPSIDNPPLCVVPSHPSAVAKSNHVACHDSHFQWEFSERNGFYSPFLYRP